MLEVISQRLLALLQLTRMALVFTAISNCMCSILLATRRANPDAPALLDILDWRTMLCAAFISIGLYGFGMSLNDIIDRRRDQHIASHRPLPSGRIHLVTAHIICLALGLVALIAGAVYADFILFGWRSFILLLWTGLLIAFYDFAGKYLVATGLLTLGLIRFFHALIPTPQLPLVWHPLLLFTHVSILSAVAYAWEEKRPPLTRLHWFAVFGGVALIDLCALLIVWAKSLQPSSSITLWLKTGLLLPLGLAALFVLLAWHIRRRTASARQAGQTLMLAGLLWLIIYDAAFVTVYVGLAYGAAFLALAPISYLLVCLMRWWSKIILLSQQPAFKRIRNGP